jgi:MFS family permease
MANVNASNFTVATLALRKYFHIDATHAVYLTALNVLMFGVGNLLWIPMMRITGKRPVYLLALLVLIFSNVWSARARTYGSLLASRMISGIGASAADATVPSAVSELYEARHRGAKMMFFHIALASGIFLGPLINAYVVQEHGWRWSPAWIAIATSFVFILAVFLIHETQYSHLRNSADWKPRRSFFSYLSLHRGFSCDAPLQKAKQALKDIFVMASYPPILFASSVVGLFVGWTIVIQVSIAQTFLQPPYSWTLARVGLFHLAGWIGALSALYFGGLLIDFLVSKGDKQHLVNTTSPEKRLPALVIPFIIAPFGLIVYGICLSEDTIWIGPAAGYAMHSFGFVAVSNIVVTYAVDTYKNEAGEAMVILFIVRNLIAVVCSMYCFPWILRDGLRAVFGTMAGLEWALMLFGLPLLFLAERIKKFTGRYGPERRARERLEALDEEGRPTNNREAQAGLDGTVE